MKCISSEKIAGNPKLRMCVIIADVTPNVLPTTGAGVDDLDDDIVIAPGSALICLDESATYIAGETGAFTKWGA